MNSIRPRVVVEKVKDEVTTNVAKVAESMRSNQSEAAAAAAKTLTIAKIARNLNLLIDHSRYTDGSA